MRGNNITKFVTTKDAAILLGVNASRVRQLLIAGAINGQKIGRDWIIDVAAIKRYCAR